MGEYAKLNGQSVKIGTCEDLYYLRADQAHLVQAEHGSVDPMAARERAAIRFRFPWPDEDGTEPGAFERFDRAVAVPGAAVPAAVEHHMVQFVARQGYNVSLPCPESQQAVPGLTVHRNGFAGAFQIVQQAYRNGVLALIGQCGGCGARFNLPTWDAVEPVVVAVRSEGDRHERREPGAGQWWHTIADRITAGYEGAQ